MWVCSAVKGLDKVTGNGGMSWCLTLSLCVLRCGACHSGDFLRALHLLQCAHNLGSLLPASLVQSLIAMAVLQQHMECSWQLFHWFSWQCHTSEISQSTVLWVSNNFNLFTVFIVYAIFACLCHAWLFVMDYSCLSLCIIEFSVINVNGTFGKVKVHCLIVCSNV